MKRHIGRATQKATRQEQAFTPGSREGEGLFILPIMVRRLGAERRDRSLGHPWEGVAGRAGQPDLQQVPLVRLHGGCLLQAAFTE